MKRLNSLQKVDEHTRKYVCLDNSSLSEAFKLIKNDTAPSSSQGNEFVDLTDIVIIPGSDISKLQTELWKTKLSQLGVDLSTTLHANVTHIIAGPNCTTDQVNYVFLSRRSLFK